MRLRSISVALAVTLAGVFGAAVPAQAAGANCDNGYFCLFADTNYAGTRTLLAGGACATNVGSANDKASSVYNNTGYTVRFYQDTNLGGKYILVAAHSGASALSSVVIYNADGTFFGINTLNDRISSAC
ncbi:peptidase inhibitor family I36 protein [Actinoplanes sp. NPDC000266]